jgi:hypothetical protein
MFYKLIYTVVIFLIIIGCENDMVATDNKTNEIIQTELGLLPKLISLPRQPESVKWQVNEDAGYLIALLNYAPHDYAYILKQSTVYLAENNEKV